MALEHIAAHLQGKRSWGDGVMRDLELSLRDQGPMIPLYEDMFKNGTYFGILTRLVSRVASAAGGGFLAQWVASGLLQKLKGVPRPPGLLMFGYASGCFSLYMKMLYYDRQKNLAEIVFTHGEEHMKKELAKMILNKHSTDKSLVELLKRHYVADHLFSDEHQEGPLFRWRQRQSYVDSAFMEKLKEELTEWVKKRLVESMDEHEANYTNDEAESSVNVGLFEEDPLACILGTPDSNWKMNMSLPQHTREMIIEQVTSTYVSNILKTTSVSDMLEIPGNL